MSYLSGAVNFQLRLDGAAAYAAGEVGCHNADIKYLSFWYHMWDGGSGHMGTLKVIAPDTNEGEVKFEKVGQQVTGELDDLANSGWLKKTNLVLNAPSFRFDGTRGSSYKGDMAVANVCVP